MSLDIIKYPNGILTRPAERVTDYSFAQSLSEKMLKKVKDLKAAGLAAPQVGYSLNLFVITCGHFINSVWVNPMIVKRSSKIVYGAESCLSIDGAEFNVPRHSWIVVSGFSADGVMKDLTLDGIEARIFQHELDHLDGKLINQYENIRRS